MSNDIKKRKAREEKNKLEKLKREKASTKKRQAEKLLVLQERQMRKDMRKANRNQEHLEKWADGFMENLDKLPEETRAKILHNIEILKALEDEYEKEQDGRKAINDQLEAEGFTTLQDKLDALHSDLVKQQEESSKEIIENNLEIAKVS